VIALDVGECATEAFWRSFLRSLVERGLAGVQLVASDAHAGMKQAIRWGIESLVQAVHQVVENSMHALPVEPRGCEDGSLDLVATSLDA
jgi:transposase-like protein